MITIICDIDGTICTAVQEAGKWVYEKHTPIPNRIKKMNSLFDKGCKIIYWTARGSSSGIDYSELTKKQLKDWNVKYTELRMGKPSYDVWIDDKALNDIDFFSNSFHRRL